MRAPSVIAAVSSVSGSSTWKRRWLTRATRSGARAWSRTICPSAACHVVDRGVLGPADLDHEQRDGPAIPREAQVLVTKRLLPVGTGVHRDPLAGAPERLAAEVEGPMPRRGAAPRLAVEEGFDPLGCGLVLIVAWQDELGSVAGSTRAATRRGRCGTIGGLGHERPV